MRIISLRPAGQAGIPEPVLRLDYESALDGRRDWSLVWPAAGAKTWLVNIHGHGSHGDQLYTRPDVREFLLTNFRRLGGSIISPNLRDNAWMSPAAEADLSELLAWLRSEYGAERFVFFSGSMGGTSNLIYAVRQPQDVGMLVALCPATDLALLHEYLRPKPKPILQEIADAIEAACGGRPADRPAVYQARSAVAQAERLTMPIYLVHGDADQTIPVEHARRLAGRMGAGVDFTYVEIPNGGHDSPISHLGAYDWLRRRW